MTHPQHRSKRLVDRQLRKAGLQVEPGTPLDRFIELVRSSYDEADDSRRLNDHAFAVASAEMSELNGRLSANNAALNSALDELTRSEAIEELNQKLSTKNDELQHALESQTRTQQLFESLASNSPLAIIYTDQSGNAVYTNDRSSLLLDRPASDLLGVEWIRLIPPSQRADFRVFLGDDTIETAVIEHQMEHRDGTLIWCSTTIAAVRHTDALGGWIASIEDITQRKRGEAELERLATTDSLTGLLNRHSFGLSVQQLRETLAGDTHLALALIDMDRFKLVNDTFGHQAGDQLLITIAEILRAQAQDGDLIARLGGDEFAFARVVADAEEAETFVRELSDSLHQPVVVERQMLHTGASVGLALATERSADPEELLRDADTAMYRAKADNSRRYRIFDQRFREEVTRRFVLERELHLAIESKAVTLAFQPIIDAASEQTIAVEALARWESEALGVVSPLEFIEAAEHLGLSRVLGRQILEMACGQLGAWYHDQPWRRGLAVSVNVTYGQLVDQNFVELVHQTLVRNRLPGSALILELTEQALLDDFDRAVGVLQRLRQMGVRIAIDDFGTGYSALSYLARLKVDFLKIDQSFVQRLSSVGDEGDNRLTEAIVDLAHRFELTPIAEGVETESQQQMLRTFGCGLLQGYLFARPMWPDDPALAEVVDGGRVPTTAPEGVHQH
jgi:diguanylate cyclase (GGDEF)-like protein/PAS domain S-box-containing protein